MFHQFTAVDQSENTSMQAMEIQHTWVYLNLRRRFDTCYTLLVIGIKKNKLLPPIFSFAAAIAYLQRAARPPAAASAAVCRARRHVQR